jgi:hypothetical protein
MNKKEDDSSSFSTAKTDSSTINKDYTTKNEEDDLYTKTRQRAGIKHKINSFQPGRATINVPITSFNGISHNASFQSKLLFFNGGKPRPKFQHIPYAHERIPEDNKKNVTTNKIEKKKNENDFDDINSNININQITESKDKNQNSDNNNNGNKNKYVNKYLNKVEKIDEEDELDIKKISHKKNTIYIPSSFSIDNKIQMFSKFQKEDKQKIKKTDEDKQKIKKIEEEKQKTKKLEDEKQKLKKIEEEKQKAKKVEEEKQKIKKPVNIANKNIKLKTLDEQWSFQKILLDYNILDFTSKFYIF